MIIIIIIIILIIIIIISPERVDVSNWSVKKITRHERIDGSASAGVNVYNCSSKKLTILVK